MRLILRTRAQMASFCDPKCLGALLLAIGLLLQAPGLAQAKPDDLESSAQDFMESIGHEAQEILGSDHMSSDEKIAGIQRLLQNSVDLKRAGRRVLGPRWRTATEAQRNEYSLLFASYALKIYPRALLQHRSQEFVITGTKRSAGGDTLVFSHVKGAGGQSIRWSWRVGLVDGDCKIVDLIADGISMTATLREEFNSYVFHHGLNGLLEKLRTVD